MLSGNYIVSLSGKKIFKGCSDKPTILPLTFGSLMGSSAVNNS